MPISNEILTAALAGLEAQRTTLDQQIQQVQALLGTAPKRRGRPPKDGATATSNPEARAPVRKKRSAAVRKRMAEAQRKRWAELKKHS